MLKKKSTCINNDKESLSGSEFSRLEFFRHAAALLPSSKEKHKAIAYIDLGPDFRSENRFCTCRQQKAETCPHIKSLMRIFDQYRQQYGSVFFETDFQNSIWFKLTMLMAEETRDVPAAFNFKVLTDKDGFEIINKSGEVCLIWLYASGSNTRRLIERCGKPQASPDASSRSHVLTVLTTMTLSENERLLKEKGLKSRRMALEESFWHRFGRHCFHEFRGSRIDFIPEINRTDGAFCLNCMADETELVFQIPFPRHKVHQLLQTLSDHLPAEFSGACSPLPLELKTRITLDAEQNLILSPCVEYQRDLQSSACFDLETISRNRYGNLIYFPETQTFGLIAPGQLKPSNLRQVIPFQEIPEFLAQLRQMSDQKAYIPDDAVTNLRSFHKIDVIRFFPQAIERDWCWLSLEYGIGNANLSLADILRRKHAGDRYLPTENGWIDLHSPDLDLLDFLANQADIPASGAVTEKIGLSRLNLFRLKALGDAAVEIVGDDDASRRFEQLLNLVPASPLPKLTGLKSSLRSYQERGAEWLRFLYENRFGGLLCDDMGLGKTHQIMALMVWLVECDAVDAPFLVVCPTTVLHHWEQKIREHAPVLNPYIYHGSARESSHINRAGQVVLTTYGILLRDIAALAETRWYVCVFDEIQYLKNPATKVYTAAQQISANIKIGLTGTPIENTVLELKALMDQVLPGYLGTDKIFKSRYGNGMPADQLHSRQKELSRLISPFTLRRLKQTVLDELPDKIEDILTCELTDDQIKLYRDAIDSRGRALLSALHDQQQPAPYIHIFALLSLLKQICDHPALIHRQLENYRQYQSGKWELFRELLTQCLDNGQKIVVYSQYARMLQIMSSYLRELGVDFVKLTGKTQQRGQVIERFNQDPNCRIFLGSLIAGGTGIDLVAASVVIHYDRWWNAAREDQATDRVHRIGQRRSVQVFKLVSKGTLEEKISAIIQQKRNLMDAIVQEDDAELIKSFSRDQLIDILSFTGID